MALILVLNDQKWILLAMIDQKQSSFYNFCLSLTLFLLASSSLIRSGLKQWIVWQLTSSKLTGESSSRCLITSGEAMRLSMMSCLCFLNFVKTQSGIIKAPNMLKKIKKLSMPSFPLLIWAITGSFLYSAILYLRSASDFYSISKCFSPGEMMLCSIISSVTPIFKFMSLILLSLLPYKGGSTSRSTTSFISERLIFLIPLSQLSLSLFPISALMSLSCSEGGKLPNLVSLLTSGCWGPSACFSKSPDMQIMNISLGKMVGDIQLIEYQMLKIAKQLSVHIYDLFISTFLTIAAHLSLIEHMSLSEGNFLDVGCGTGKPLKSIVDKIKEKHSKVVGVDLHPEYTEKAIEMFRDDKTVQIYNMDFYTIENYLKLKFRFIFFSFSFMLMPDNLKALEICKRILEKNQKSRISFVLTINKNKNSLLAWIKPIIKKFTTVDFGNVIYEDDLYSVIDEAGLEVTKKERLYWGFNLFLRLSPVYYIECKVKA